MITTSNSTIVKWLIRLTISLVLVILLTNVFVPVRYVLGLFLGQHNSIFVRHHYATKHAYFATTDDGFFIKGETVYSQFERYKRCHPSSPDTVLYRQFQLKPWQFWEWFNYFYQPKWQLPYLPSSAIGPPAANPPKSVCTDENK